MTWIAAQIKWIMLVAGVLTCTMFYAALAPEAAVPSMFSIAVDLVMVVVFLSYLLRAHQNAAPRQAGEVA